MRRGFIFFHAHPDSVPINFNIIIFRSVICCPVNIITTLPFCTHRSQSSMRLHDKLWGRLLLFCITTIHFEAVTHRISFERLLRRRTSRRWTESFSCVATVWGIIRQYIGTKGREEKDQKISNKHKKSIVSYFGMELE
jgi:hypothetical protein